MRRMWQLGWLLILALLASCGEATTIGFAELCQQSNNDNHVKTEGYLAVASSIFCSNIGASQVQCGLELVDDASNTSGIAAEINEGTGKNQIVVPENYTKETIVVHDDTGALVKLGEKVQLEGKIVVNQINGCLIKVETIKRLP